MTALNASSADSWYRSGSPKTGQTDDARIKEITVLPPPEHLIRFFPIRGTAVESLISDTRRTIHNIMHREDDRLLVIIGPCSIHDPAAALDYARRLAVVRAVHGLIGIKRLSKTMGPANAASEEQREAA